MRGWKPSTAGEDLFLRVHECVGRQVIVSPSDDLDFLCSADRFREFVHHVASLEVFMRTLRVARTFVETHQASTPVLQLGNELAREVDLPQNLCSDRAFCETARLAARVVSEARRDDRVERAAVRDAEMRCYMCGIALTRTKDAIDQATVEHLWPLSFGGETVVENLVRACLDCNRKRDVMLTWASGPVQSTFHKGSKAPDSLVRISLGLARLVRVAQGGAKPLTLKEAAQRSAPLYVAPTLDRDTHYLYSDLLQLTEALS